MSHAPERRVRQCHHDSDTPQSGSSTTSRESETASPAATAGGDPNRTGPHPNACLTCPDLQTTPEFLDIHRRQAASNRKLIARADSNGQFRLAENLRQVQASLDNIIPALEAIERNLPE